MTTATTDALSGPPRALADNARHETRRRIHQGTVAAWLLTLQLDSVEALFDAVAGDNIAATSLLVKEHRRGTHLATTVLLGAKARMLSAISRNAPGESREERFQVAVDAYLTRALARCKPDHAHLDAQLYWITLRTVHNLHRTRVEIPESLGFGFSTAGDDHPGFPSKIESAPAADIVVNIQDHLTASIVLDWAQSRGLLNARDRHALDVRYGGDRVLPVREVAHQLNVSEDSLETRLRRALRRLSDGVQEDGVEFQRACIDALWPQQRVAEDTKSALVA